MKTEDRRGSGNTASFSPSEPSSGTLRALFSKYACYPRIPPGTLLSGRRNRYGNTCQPSPVRTRHQAFRTLGRLFESGFRTVLLRAYRTGYAQRGSRSFGSGLRELVRPARSSQQRRRPARVHHGFSRARHRGGIRGQNVAVPHPQRRDRSGGTGRPDSARLSRRRTAPLAEPAPQLSRKRTARRHALRRTTVRRSAGRLGRARADHAVDTEHAVRTVEVLQRRALLHQQNPGSTSSFRRTGVSGRPAEPFRRSPPERRDEAGQSGKGHPRRRLGRGAAPADLQRRPPAVAAAVGRPHLAGLRAPAGTGLASRPARLQPRTGRRAARTAPAVPAGGDPRAPVHRAADMDGHLAHAPSPARPDRRHRPARRRRSGHAVPAFAVPRRGGRDAGRLRAGPRDPAGLLPQPRGQRRRPAAAEQRTRHRQKNPEVHVAPRLSRNAGRAAPGKHRHGPRSLRRSVRMLRGPGAPVLRHGRRLRQGRARRPFPVRFPAARPSPCRGPGNSCSASGRSNGIRRSRWNSRRDSPCCCTRTARTKPSARPTPRAANSTATSVLPRPSQWKGRRPVRRGIPAPAGSERRPALYDGRQGSREGTRTSGSPSPARTPPPLREWCGCRLFSMLRPRRRRPAPPRRPDRRESPGNPRRSAPATACRRRRRSR